MNIWILGGHSGIMLFFKSYLNMPIKKHLISGLLTALNQFTLSEFQQPIEAIDMGGFTWIYILDDQNDLLFVACDTKDTKAEMLRARLSVIKDSFVKKYVMEKKIWKKNWDGNVTPFEPFEETIDRYISQWKEAESLSSFADFFDSLGVFQQLFMLIEKTIKNQIGGMLKDYLLQRIQEVFEAFHEKEIIEDEPELNKIRYTWEEGFNLLTINPKKSNIQLIHGALARLIKECVLIMKEEIGYEASLKYFSRENLFNYLMNNLSLLKKLGLDTFLLDTFLLRSPDD